MAEARKDKDPAASEAEEQPKPKKSRRKLIIFGASGILALAILVSGTFWLFGGKKKAVNEDEDLAATEEVVRHGTSDQPPIYLKLDTFTTNLAMEDGVPSGTAGQYIQLVIELKVGDSADSEMLKQYMPEIRNNILRLLSSKRPSQLASPDGKDLLANEIRNSVNGVANPGARSGGRSRGPVESVLFSSFIIQ